jgi:hypothetical protein
MGVSTGPIASPIIQDAVILLDADDVNSVKKNYSVLNDR